MNSSPTMWITVGLLFGTLVGAVGAEVMGPEDTVEKPPERQYDDGHCYEYQVKMLESVVNSGTVEEAQLFEIKARAYATLDGIGQKC